MTSADPASGRELEREHGVLEGPHVALARVTHAELVGAGGNLYIEVHNMFTTRMRANHDNYVPTLAGLDPQNPCTLERQPGGDMYHTADSTGTIPEFRRRLRRGPRLPQDRLVTAMLDAAAIQVPAWNAAFDYYGRNVFRNDNCAQGNVYHRQLMGAFEAYFAADAELLVFIDTEHRARRVTELAATERTHGRNFRYVQLSLMNEVAAMRAGLSAATLDLDALTRSADALAAGLAEIKPRADSAEREIHTLLYEGGYLTFLRSIESLVESARAAVTTLRDPRARPNDRERRMGDFQRQFTAAIQASNSVRYSDRVH